MQGNVRFATDSQVCKRTSDGDLRAEMFHQMWVTAADTTCGVKGVLRPVRTIRCGCIPIFVFTTLSLMFPKWTSYESSAHWKMNQPIRQYCLHFNLLRRVPFSLACERLWLGFSNISKKRFSPMLKHCPRCVEPHGYIPKHQMHRARDKPQQNQYFAVI